ncbi:MAG: hypothetical protein ACOC9B_00440, partial [Chloroflexota bacterium]
MTTNADNTPQHDIYAELSRLNNELVNVRRQLEQRNADLERLAYHDTVTGLFNRRSILEKLN